MMVCGHCGKTITAELQRCPYCGTEQTSSADVATPVASRRKDNSLPLIGGVMLGVIVLYIVLSSLGVIATPTYRSAAQNFNAGVENLREAGDIIKEGAGGTPSPKPSAGAKPAE